MKTLILFFSSCFLLAEAQQKALVTKVVDGDTYDLFYNGKTSRVRIAHVDAPEMKQNYGAQAALIVKQLINWKLVQFDSTGKDFYGRKVGNLLFNGKRLDSILVRNGLAWYNAAYGKDAMLNNCMQLAINESKGLWICGTDSVCPPWLFRTYSYQNRVKYCWGCSGIIFSQFKN